MNKILAIYKPIGMTPLEAIQHVRGQFGELKDEKISYVGRLDPMAQGLLLLAIGDALKEREKFLQMQKTYIFTVLFGVTTDTYDVLGLLASHKYNKPKNVNQFVNTFVVNHIGKQLQPFPPYSSRTVQGKPLFQWAREGRIAEIEIPVKEIVIEDFSVQSMENVQGYLLEKQIEEKINKVAGDFRQEEIKAQWKSFFEKHEQTLMQTATFQITCSTGTYVRNIAHQIGRELGCGAIALDIKRTKIGDYTVKEAIRLTD